MSVYFILAFNLLFIKFIIALIFQNRVHFMFVPASNGLKWQIKQFSLVASGRSSFSIGWHGHTHIILVGRGDWRGGVSTCSHVPAKNTYMIVATFYVN